MIGKARQSKGMPTRSTAWASCTSKVKVCPRATSRRWCGIESELTKDRPKRSTTWGVPQRYKEASAWFRKAAKQGYAKGQCNLGAMYAQGHGVAKSSKETAVLLRKAAEQVFIKAQCSLGALYA